MSVPFQVDQLRELKFAQILRLEIGKTSKANGASLTAKLTYPSGRRARRQTSPGQSRTAQATALKADDAAESVHGRDVRSEPSQLPGRVEDRHAKVTTPLLPVPLEGPAYFVSHGGEAFPQLTMVLQGYGVTVDLVGTTFISKAGITSTTFKTVPDVPFSSFELTLPKASTPPWQTTVRRKHCGQKLTMPTGFVAQNGAELHQSTPLESHRLLNQTHGPHPQT